MQVFDGRKSYKDPANHLDTPILSSLPFKLISTLQNKAKLIRNTIAASQQPPSLAPLPAPFLPPMPSMEEQFQKTRRLYETDRSDIECY